MMMHPVKRWKSKLRVIGRHHNNYVRLYPNFGWTIGRWHWCRAKHERGH